MSTVDYIVLSGENVFIKINLQENVNDDKKSFKVTTIKAELIDKSKSWQKNK